MNEHAVFNRIQTWLIPFPHRRPLWFISCARDCRGAKVRYPSSLSHHKSAGNKKDEQTEAMETRVPACSLSVTLKSGPVVGHLIG